VPSIKPMRLVTYHNNTQKKAKKKPEHFNHQDPEKTSISAQGSARVLGMRNGEIQDSSDSIINDRKSVNDFVIDRESMNFRRVPDR
jgi:hypothetical protein